MINRKQELTAKDAAQLLGITMSGLRKLRTRGDITGRQIAGGRDWYYTMSELAPHMGGKFGVKGGTLGRPRGGGGK